MILVIETLRECSRRLRRHVPELFGTEVDVHAGRRENGNECEKKEPCAHEVGASREHVVRMPRGKHQQRRP